jgi:hypothetical protein
MELLPEADWLGAVVESHARVSYEAAKTILSDAEGCFRRARGEERIRALELERREAEAAGRPELAEKLGTELKAALCELHGISRVLPQGEATDASGGVSREIPPGGDSDAGS